MYIYILTYIDIGWLMYQLYRGVKRCIGGGIFKHFNFLVFPFFKRLRVKHYLAGVVTS